MSKIMKEIRKRYVCVYHVHHMHDSNESTEPSRDFAIEIRVQNPEDQMRYKHAEESHQSNLTKKSLQTGLQRHTFIEQSLGRT